MDGDGEQPELWLYIALGECRCLPPESNGFHAYPMGIDKIYPHACKNRMRFTIRKARRITMGDRLMGLTTVVALLAIGIAAADHRNLQRLIAARRQAAKNWEGGQVCYFK